MATRKIMVVDDSPTDLAFVSGILKRCGFDMILVGGGDAAIARSRSEQPDLIVMDLVMPGTSGFHATRAITRDPATKHIPVIICTSRNQETDRIWGLRQGARDYITKPVNEGELVNKVKALMSLHPVAA